MDDNDWFNCTIHSLFMAVWMVLLYQLSEWYNSVCTTRACLFITGFFQSYSVTIVVSQFIIGTTVSLLTEPITLGSAVSLFSKKVAPDVQGRHA